MNDSIEDSIIHLDRRRQRWDKGYRAIAGLPEGSLLHRLPPSELEKVWPRLKRVFYPARAVLIPEGTWHGMLYIVIRGVLDVSVRASDGSTKHLARLTTGDSAGEMSLMTGAPTSATVSALIDTELWALPAEDFHELLATCPTLAANMAVTLSRRLARTNRGAAPRVARLMRLNLHPATPSGLPEAIARAAATHIGAPLLVLDCRSSAAWRGGERLPELDITMVGGELAAILRRQTRPGVLAVGTRNLAADAWTRFEEHLSHHVTHVLVLTEAAAGTHEWMSALTNFKSHVTLWPQSAGGGGKLC